MKGCARTCLLQLLGWAAFSVGFYVYLRRTGELVPQLYWASAGAGLCVALSIGYAMGITQAARERRSLLEAATGAPPADGEWVAVSGRIQSTESLRGPLSDENVVVYEYRIHRTEGSGKSRSDTNVWSGKALVPSIIATRHGSVRLLAVPALTDIAPARLPPSAADNARSYVAATEFVSPQTAKERTAVTEGEWTDDDGNYRLDRGGNRDDVDPGECSLEEKHIRNGETVCAFGLYSQQRGGIIPHSNWAKQMRVMRGDAITVAGDLRTRMIKYSFGVLIFGAAAYGVVYFYAKYAATHVPS
jgi:hypothetical protein